MTFPTVSLDLEDFLFSTQHKISIQVKEAVEIVFGPRHSEGQRSEGEVLPARLAEPQEEPSLYHLSRVR